MCGTLMMNAWGPSLNSCIINITGNKLEFNLASWITNKTIFKLQVDDFVSKESPGWNYREREIKYRQPSFILVAPSCKILGIQIDHKSQFGKKALAQTAHPRAKRPLCPRRWPRGEANTSHRGLKIITLTSLCCLSWNLQLLKLHGCH